MTVRRNRNSLAVLFRFLTGRRDAIEIVAADRRWLGVGLLLVLGAALAREYDGEYLIAELWYLVIPVAASIVTSFLLFAFVFLVFLRRVDARPPFWMSYSSFLSAFWATAPLALLYAIPYERFLGEYEAASANLWTLAIVSVWRVLLITRVVSVLAGVSWITAFFPVMLFADGFAFAALSLSPQPIIHFMGGARLSPTAHLIQGTMIAAGSLMAMTAPLWIFGTLLILISVKGENGAVLSCPATARADCVPMRFAVGSILIWILLLPFTQPEQRRRYQVEQLLARGDIAEGLALMSRYERAEFPPHYDPRPRNFVGQDTPPNLEIMQAIIASDVPPWVRKTYSEKLKDELVRSMMPDYPWDELATVLERLDEGPAIARELLDSPWWSSIWSDTTEVKVSFTKRVKHLAESTSIGVDGDSTDNVRR